MESSHRLEGIECGGETVFSVVDGGLPIKHAGLLALVGGSNWWPHYVWVAYTRHIVLLSEDTLQVHNNFPGIANQSDFLLAVSLAHRLDFPRGLWTFL